MKNRKIWFILIKSKQEYCSNSPFNTFVRPFKLNLMDFYCQKVTIPERRAKPRINCRFPVVIRAHDANGKKYEVIGKLSNLSASGIFFWVNHPIQIGEKVFVMVQLSKSIDDQEKHRLVISGHALRTEPQPDGIIGVAIKCERYQFL